MCAIVDILLVLVIILIVVLVWRGPSMLPQFGAALGKAVRGARDNIDRDTTESPAPSDAPAAKDDDATSAR